MPSLKETGSVSGQREDRERRCLGVVIPDFDVVCMGCTLVRLEVEERGGDTVEVLGEDVGGSKEATDVGGHERWKGLLGEVFDSIVGDDELEGVEKSDSMEREGVL